MKTCTKCNTTKDLKEFRISGKYIVSRCRECERIICQEYKEKNREALNARRAADRKEHPEKWKESNKRFYSKNAEAQKLRAKEYAQANRKEISEKQREARKARRHADSAYRAKENIRKRMWETIIKAGHTKSAKTLSLLGCSPLECRNYLESLFTEGMSWDNYGPTGWHIDHIKPISSFDLSNPQEQKECFHYTNLQPLWALDNLIKADSMPSDLRQ
jgi:phage-related minor tail protein